MTIQEIEHYIEEAGTEQSDDFGAIGLKGGVRSQQIPDELAPIIKLLSDNGGVKNYCEVGAAAGGTAYLIHHFFKPSKMVLVDDNKHPNAWRRAKILESVDRYEIIGKSADGKTTDALELYMGDEEFDLIFIDAEHSYSECKRDTILYKQYVKIGGHLLFHDSLHPYPAYGVYRVVQELKRDDRWQFVAEFASRVKQPLGLALFKRIQ